MGPRAATRKRLEPEWTREGCRLFETVDELLRSVIGYVHGTGHPVVSHEFEGGHSIVGPDGLANLDWGSVYYGFRAPSTGRRWAVSNWKMVRHHRVNPNDFSEWDPLDESSFDFVVHAMCTVRGRRRLAQMARTNELDRLLAMRKVMSA